MAEFKSTISSQNFDKALQGGLDYAADKSGIQEALAEKISVNEITLGRHSDGLVYIFVGGTPVGIGLDLSEKSEEPEINYGQPVVDNAILSIAKGQTVQLGVKLSEKPTQEQTITVLTDNDALTFDKTVLTFTPDNWSEFQFLAVTLGDISEDATATITLRNSDEFLTDTTITVYLTADSYSVDMTIPEGAHVCTIEDFPTHYTRNGVVSLGAYSGEYTNIFVPATMSIDGVDYAVRVSSAGTGTNAFNGNTTIQYVEFEEGVTSGTLSLNNPTTNSFDSMFTNCSSLIGIKFRVNATSLASAFYGCTNLKFADGVEKCTACANMFQAFMGCSSLEYVPDLSDLTAVTGGQSTFNGCTSLKKVYGVPPGLEAKMLYYKCAALETAEIPAGATTMFYCFDGCTALKEVKVYAEGVTDANTAFGGCSGVKVYVPEGSTTYETINAKYGSSATIEILYLDGDAVPVVSAWGDSTTSTGTDGEAWPARLQSKIGGSHLVKNMAISGEFCTSTSCRQGGNQASLVAGVTIPADATAVSVSLVSADGQTFGTSPVLSTGANYNPVTIAGVEGAITSSGGAISFTRKVAGNAVDVATGTPVISKNAETRRGDYCQIIYLGTNAGWNLDINTLLNQVQSMVDYYGGANYIIMGPAGGQFLRTDANRATVFAYEELAAEAFGDHWLNLREYLIANSLTENGLTATDKDTERMAVGLVPWSILMGSKTENGTDDVHYNTHGLQSVCNAVYAKGKALGYWE